MLTDHETPSDPFLSDGDGMIRTTSHLRMWRLIMYGYHIVRTSVIPRKTVFGRMRYTRIWDLMPPRETRAV